MKVKAIDTIRWQRVMLCVALLASVTTSWANDETPAQIIEQTAGNILTQIILRRPEFKDNPQALKDLVRKELMPMLDQEYSARLILGRHGRGLDPEKIREFGKALSAVLTDRYSNGLLYFRSKNQMEILPPNPNDSERLTRVRTRILLENGGAAPVDYAFHKTEKGWKVFDVTVEGVSYVLTFRNQLAPKVASQGIDKVTAELLAGVIEISGS